ncbi:MAG: VOC family protein [Spongiibacteraceae bacterium]|nr:VOC family protein [Spongiibacteraceae bacterium]
MTILRIETVIYGVEDLALCQTFFEDVGLELVSSEASLVVFRTPVNQFVHLRRLDDPALPAAVQEGSTVREVIWGVDCEQSLDNIRAELSTDRAVIEDDNGVLHSQDETGYGIGFTVAKPEAVNIVPRKYNVSGHINRLNEGVPKPYSCAHPLRLIHVAYDIPKLDRQQANDFYTQRLHFRAIDTVRPMGTFMQCEGDIEHHNFLLCHRTDRPGINHIAFEVRDIDEVVEGGNHMNAQGWKESRRFGRHNLGSNVFRMFQSPCGGRIEYAADMDRMDKTFEPRVWDESPPHHHWMLKSPGSSDA